ncbi:hypothetical protein OG689_20970 [Kitasatospora sp. NBC_00240]|uniref:hypothetical protein n=1 Tax=Kitasatospora sp. NBC_00240 TaxID=2903567 RepID=UPI00224CC59F|nr:hypothetical protein [Kitasatospora sp. NBC_00240]MCX5211732.1 hypothetical protein [Kitasatospora sp. NBC_00240]
MSLEAALLESRTLRDGLSERVDALDKVKILALLPDGVHATTRMVADYYEVPLEAVKSHVKDHREELERGGYRVLAGQELREFKALSGIDPRTPWLGVFPRRAVLNVAMLLRDSPVARRVRSYLLDAEETARPTARPGVRSEPEVFRAAPPRRRRQDLHRDEYESLRDDPAGQAWRRRIDGLEPFEPVRGSDPATAGSPGTEERLSRIESRLDAHGAVIMAMGDRLCRYGDDLRAVRGDVTAIRRDVAELRRGRRA